ncbi:MAG: restriction endonuclease subunit S, partial [Acetobacter sp.]|nr:restriction endonuclease subunit S [Acetobacter sp.]
KEGTLLRYLFQFLQTVDVSDLVRGAIPKLTGKDFRAIQIPLPPLSVQREIVEILDQFHTLTTSLTEGLPAEIEARRKQYHYYRNKLLTFKDLAPSPKE